MVSAGVENWLRDTYYTLSFSLLFVNLLKDSSVKRYNKIIIPRCDERRRVRFSPSLLFAPSLALFRNVLFSRDPSEWSGVE